MFSLFISIPNGVCLILSVKQLFAEKKGIELDSSNIGYGIDTILFISISLLSLQRYKVISPIIETFI